MEKTKFWINASIKFLVILFAGFIIYSWNQPKNRESSLSPDVQWKIDSLNKFNQHLMIENERYKERTDNLYVQISQLENTLTQIQPSTERKIMEYHNASPDKKKKIIDQKVLLMQQEMDNKSRTESHEPGVKK